MMTTNRLYYAYARHALVTALKLVRVQAGSSVLVPDFICRDVLSSLHAVGADPIFYPIGDDLQMAMTQSLPSAQTVIVVNYFGFPADLRSVRNFVSGHSAIIEDNAHGWLSVDRDGNPLGSRADVGITSVRKTIRLPDGAFVEWHRSAQLDTTALHDPLSPRNEALPCGFRLRRIVARIDSVSPVSVMGASRHSVRKLRRLRGRPAVSERPDEEWQLPHHRAIHSESLRLLESVDQVREVQRRRQLFARCLSAAQRYDIDTPTPLLNEGVSPQGFAYFADTGNVAAFAKLVRRERLGEIITWPALSARSPLPTTSRLRTLHLVNFLA
jgi:hypothetical protein